jgi:hypothetical protein
MPSPIISNAYKATFGISLTRYVINEKNYIIHSQAIQGSLVIFNVLHRSQSNTAIYNCLGGPKKSETVSPKPLSYSYQEKLVMSCCMD